MNYRGTRVVGDPGDPAAQPGSRAWALDQLYAIQAGLSDVATSGRRLRDLLRRMDETGGYRQLKDARGRPFKTYRAFCEVPAPFGVGIPGDVIDQLVSDGITAVARVAEVRKLGKQGRPTKQEQRHKGVNHTFSRGTGQAAYNTARLERDRPDLHAQVMTGARSPHAAAIEAGFVKKRVIIPVERLERYERALRRITELDPIGTGSSYANACEDAKQWARAALGEVS